jgi:formate dehydrogenase subunit delta
MSPDRLVHMANQIGKFFESQPGNAADGIATHIRKFWDPRMRKAIYAFVEAGGEGLDPPVREALAFLRDHETTGAALPESNIQGG